ncbi:aminotransferase class V-fold PLP-dependent enzyme [Herbiconiux solani]|uniref:aminotransferase class V-fold PLP-dependent enzyme n=1 Tax=Herbiconiux solani TaxID=661329 RepID=UPI000825EF7D|nr:aminotransferase class V-fold PLP-dependent enzyme [Herbiconiux solani]
MTAPFETYRAQFGEDEGYLNFASYGPPSRAAAEESARLFGLAVSGADSGAELHSADRRALAAAARLAGREVSAVQLSPSTSHGLFQVAFGLAGGDVLVSAAEFPANLYPWWRAEQAGRIRTVTMGDGTPQPVTPELVAASLTPSVTAVSVSAVDFRTGHRADLAGLREVVGDRLLIVDGIQGFGVLDLPWQLADALVVGGQKWLRAGWGTGFVAYSARALERLEPTLGGWTGVEQPTLYDGAEHPVQAGAQRFSVTNGSPFASGALATALELVEDAGVGTIAAAVAERVELLVDRLVGAGAMVGAVAGAGAGMRVALPEDPARRSGIVPVVFAPGRAEEAHRALAAQGVTTTLHGPDRIRFSVHATTTLSSLDLVGDILKGLR